ncbi:D(2) dopamine receptor-like [Lytechinus variegatus]|uniref:D(2) dopamine receptor-like n=1 Tax=Lytechinus variegatus TaxID=7654 RepID=UPI001BB15528|nr:D(2) dopamine receptor-like [Lytechinus variegatus]
MSMESLGSMDSVNDTEGPQVGMLQDANGNGTIDPEEKVSIVAMIFLPIIIFVGVFGNTLVCIAVIRIHKLRTVANSFVVSLAISDLAVCVIVLPLGLYEAINFGSWYLGDILCNTWLSLDIILSTASVWNLCAIAGDRYLAITKPIWYANRRSSKLAFIAIAAAWGLPVLLTVPSTILMYHNARDYENVCYLNVNLSYVIIACILAFFLPCVLVLGVYIRIFMAARDHFLRKPSAARNRKKSSSAGTDRSLDSMGDSSGNANAGVTINGKTEYTMTGSAGSINALNNPARKISTSASTENSLDLLDNRPPLKRRTSRIPRISVSREKKAAIVLSIVVGAFIICWLPYFTAVLLYAASGGRIVASDEAFVAFSWLGWLNSIINPIIYTIFTKDFRKAFKYILKCQCDNWIPTRTSSSR